VEEADRRALQFIPAPGEQGRALGPLYCGHCGRRSRHRVLFFRTRRPDGEFDYRMEFAAGGEPPLDCSCGRGRKFLYYWEREQQPIWFGIDLADADDD
jgi:hypothetical protein